MQNVILCRLIACVCKIHPADAPITEFDTHTVTFLARYKVQAINFGNYLKCFFDTDSIKESLHRYTNK